MKFSKRGPFLQPYGWNGNPLLQGDPEALPFYLVQKQKCQTGRQDLLCLGRKGCGNCISPRVQCPLVYYLQAQEERGCSSLRGFTPGAPFLFTRVLGLFVPTSTSQLSLGLQRVRRPPGPEN